MKLLVTGGAGFIGVNFILHWLKRYPQDKIINLDKLTYAGNIDSLKGAGNNPNYTFVKGDICDHDLVDRLMKDTDIIVHFAAETHVDRSITDPSPFIKTNIEGTHILLESALKNKIQRFHHISCYDDQTRALTKNGLKYYWELQGSDEVLSLNTKTKYIEWKKIAKIIVQDYSGEMIEIKSDKLDMKVTPNHRMLLETPKAKKLIFKEARNLGSCNNLPEGIWKGIMKVNKNFMYLLGYFIGDGCLAYQEKKVLNKSGLSKVEYINQSRDLETGQFLRLEHRGTQQYTICHSYRIFLDVPTKDKGRKKLEKALTNLNIIWHQHSGKSGEHLYFSSKRLGDVFKECGTGALQKTIPKWALEADKKSLESLFFGLIDADGHWGKTPKLYTSSWKLVETFSELCIKLGYKPHIFKRKAKGNYYKGRLIEGQLNYIITVTKQHRSIRIGKKLSQVFRSNYNGKIWCLKIPENKNFLVERNGTFVFCGNTDEVFGALPLNTSDKFNEKTPYNPRSPYSASKAASDHLVRAYHITYGLPVTISNCSNNFGPYQHTEKLIPLTITNLLENKKVPVYGDGLYVRDWLYVEDHVEGIDLILQKGKIGETYFIGGLTEDVANIEIIKKILKIMNKDESYIEYVQDRPGHDRRYAIDWSKISRELGWKPKHNFEEYLKQTIDWYTKNQDWWRKLKI